MISLSNYIKNNKLKIIVKPNSQKNEIIKWDNNKKALRINIKSAPEKGKANQEIIKFFSKLFKKKISITSGIKSREKTLSINI
ncbi:DUF167 domain-containing protein [Candidatus Woesearchaeota archaeon]|nr:DUF167 domain-containing protein [Candidatus Woesearchaeota archaeon]